MAEQLTAEQAMDKLKKGNANFVEDMMDGIIHNSDRREDLVDSQHPFAIVLSCADSRVVPEYAFDKGLGDLFVIRVAGNIANPSSVASIEYAVANLGVNLIVVLGHENCGAVTAAIAGGDNGPNLNHLLDHIQPAVNSSPSKNVNDVVKTNAKMTADQLSEKSGIIKDALKTRLKIVPAFYNLDSGKVDFM